MFGYERLPRPEVKRLAGIVPQQLPHNSGAEAQPLAKLILLGKRREHSVWMSGIGSMQCPHPVVTNQ